MSDSTKDIGDLEREVESLRAAISLLHRVNSLVGAALELEPTCYSILTAVTAGVGLGFNRAILFLLDPAAAATSLRGAHAVGPADSAEADRIWRSIEAEAPDLEALYQAGFRHRENPGKLDERVRAIAIDVQGDSAVALAFRRGQVVLAEGGDELDGLLDRATCIAAPMRDKRNIIGVLYADNCFSRGKTEPILADVFSMVADYGGRAIENARVYERVAGEARTDALTGLGHHGALMGELHREAAGALENGVPLGLLMLDLDGFKQVNDRLGHLAGDALLAGVASDMRNVTRAGERIYRYGGDEFAVLLRGTSRAEAKLAAERLLRTVSQTPRRVSGENEILVTCSIGVACLPDDANDADALLEAADTALLLAKKHGKNRVEMAG